MQLVFDIETVGCDFNSLPDSQKEYLLRYAEKELDKEIREQKVDEAIRYLSLYPFTAKVIAIGLYHTEMEKALVLYESETDEKNVISDDEHVVYKAQSEDEMLTTFWQYASKVDRFISFNGRNFDIPFLMLRSAIKKIKPSVNFLGNRFDTSKHIDLLEQFTFYGLIKKFNLDFYCKSFGIESPKSKGVTGMDVKQLYEAGRIKEIAVYCGQDIRATFELYKIWDEFLNLKNTSKKS
ncbi:MAG: ribonuclease H-like domain-containing protein [Melioribacteraceae bacterium]|nr:MAG: ribonuclease H-like domain-containing protein [Melioribacteraceae bacterium]